MNQVGSPCNFFTRLFAIYVAWSLKHTKLGHKQVNACPTTKNVTCTQNNIVFILFIAFPVDKNMGLQYNIRLMGRCERLKSPQQPATLPLSAQIKKIQKVAKKILLDPGKTFPASQVREKIQYIAIS